MKLKIKNAFLLYREDFLKLIMRTFILLFCTVAFSFNTNDGFSQNAKIEIVKNKTITVPEVFQLIKAQTNYTFVYNANLFESNTKVELKKGIIKVKTLLNGIFLDLDYSYEFTKNETIVVKPEQKITLKGKVIDKNGEPLIGVSVYITNDSGSKKQIPIVGTTTDFDGNYTLKYLKGTHIIFNYLGYKKAIVEINNQKIIDVTLSEELNKLDEVIITGYQKIDVRKSTGAVNTITDKDIERKGNSNLLKSLEGQVPGLTLIADPTREGEFKLDVRGVTSLNGNTNPLIIVDGFPLEGSLSTINPYEIKSINILKDAAAASIYGARAANGVVVVVTKRGKAGKTSINVRSITTVSSKPDLSYRLNRVGSSVLVDLQKSAVESNPHTYEWRYNNTSNSGFYANPSTKVYETMARLNEGKITQSQADKILASLKTKDNTKQFQKYFMQSKIERQYNLTASGGNDRNTFRTSLNFTNNQGTWIGDKSDRVILDFVNKFKITDKIDIDVAANFVNGETNRSPVNENVVFGAVNSYENLIDANGKYLPVNVGSLGNGGTNNGGIFGGKDVFEIQRLKNAGLLDESYIPLKELEQYSDINKYHSSRVQARLAAKFTNNLTGNLNFQYESSSFNNRNISSAESFEMVSLINNTTPLSYTGNENELNIPTGARLIETRGNSNSYTLRGQLDFNETFGDHEVSSIIGSEIRQTFSSSTTTDKFGYNESALLFKTIDRKYLEGNIDNVYYPAYDGKIAGGIRFFDRFSEITNRYFALYGNASYSYKNRYSLYGSIRVDQSNLFGTDPKYRYKPFWSVGAKWNVSEEDFFNVDIFNKLSIRASYGFNGNISNNFGPFNITRTVYPYRSGRVESLNIISPAIPDLRWEKTGITNLGIDMSILENRIGLNVDYYYKKTEDLLANGKSDPTQGFANLMFNDANITNKGIEIAINTVNIETKDFRWNSRITFRHNKNLVTKAFSNAASVFYRVGVRSFEGAPARSFYVFDYAGVNDKGEATIKNNDGNIVTIEPGFNPSTKLKLEDLVNAGTTEPIYTGAITNNFSYKGLGLSFLFVGSGGHVLLKDSFNGDYIGRTPSNVNSDAKYAWKKPGDEKTTDIPKINAPTYTSYITKFSTKNIISGDYLKLREVILTYDLPVSLLEKTLFKRVNFNAKATNLFYIAKNKEGIDPEAHGQYGSRFFPVNSTYSLGLTLNF